MAEPSADVEPTADAGSTAAAGPTADAGSTAEAGSADDPGQSAGAFSAWLDGLRSAVAGEQDSEVPCGSCTACCTSSQFIHIEPDEADTRAHIPKALLFPAPGRPTGHVLLGHDERGHCPMLVEGVCTIYEHRPRTCRTYDCRVLPAAGLDADADQPAIGRQVRRWHFDHPTGTDRVEHEAVRAAAAFLSRDVELAGLVPGRAAPLAVLAIEVHEAFLAADPETARPMVIEPDPHEVRVAVRRRREPPG